MINLTHEIMASSTKGYAPKVGDGGTVLLWTDRYACTLIGIEDKGKTLVYQRDTATRTDNHGRCECQEYSYAPDEDGQVYRFRQRRNGQWSEVLKSSETGRYTFGCNRLRVGYRDEHYDYSF